MEKIDEKNQIVINENIQKMKKLFPGVFTGSKLDLDKLLLLLGEHIETASERYKFTWNGKSNAIRSAYEPPTKALKPNKSNSLDWDQTANLYIEGDNLEVLKLLQDSYHNQVKMIYIDPPYNTGMDFIYNDDFRKRMSTHKVNDVDQASRHHTNWLNFMYPRLILARRLLTEDGMIFISISDKELYNLKKICDEIFGEENFVTTFIWEKKKKPSFLDRNVGCVTEYIVVFTKNNEKSHALSIEKTEQGKKYPFNNAGNTERVLTFPKGAVKFGLEDTIIQAQDMSSGNILTELLDDVIIENGRNSNAFRLKGEWRYSQRKVNEMIQNGEEFVISKVPFRPNHVRNGGDIKKMKNLFTISGYGFPTYEDADKEITDLFGVKVFDYSKPEKLIRRLIQSLLQQDDQAIVLDFFSGSATTGEAVWRYNQEQGANHQFILVQLPESIESKSKAYQAGYRTISELGKERLKLCSEKLKLEGALNIGFNFYELSDK